MRLADAGALRERCSLAATAAIQRRDDRVGSQPKSRFTRVNPQFGFMAKPLSMLMGMNIEFDCVLKPKSRFMGVNIDFGCGEPPPARRHASPSRRDELRARLTKLPGRAHRLYAELGYASVFDYADRVLDLPTRQARDLIRIGRHLPDLPVLSAALAEGDLGWTKAREIVSVATPETEAAWVARAVEVTSRVLERQVACARVGEAPPDAAAETERRPERRRISFDMQAADLEVLRQALGLMRAQLGLDAAELEDGVLIASRNKAIRRRASAIGG